MYRQRGSPPASNGPTDRVLRSAKNLIWHMVVAHIVLSLDCGGLERVVLDLTREGQKLGQQVAVICIERPGIQADQARALGAELVCLHKGPGLRLRVIADLKAVLRDLKPDVVHTHQVGAMFYTGRAARAVGVKALVHTEHNNHMVSKRGISLLKMRAFTWFAGRYAARFFCISRDAEAAVSAHRVVSRKKLYVVPNGIDSAPYVADINVESLRSSLGIPADAPVVGTVGRLSEQKRQDVLLRAFAQLPRQDARLLVVGDGPRKQELQELAAGLGIGQRVHFVGYQPQTAPYLKLMDIFALSSHIEGMPLVIIEAWAAGVPVVASRVGGVPEMIKDGRNGILFPAGDVTTLTAVLSRLLANPNDAEQLAIAGRAEASGAYTSERMASDYYRHYLDVLNHA
jgi:glycosyltransferase involved in cell wall biosynthesis